MTGGLKAADGVFSMLLTNCASCATELGLTSGKKCGRCSTRYCGPECQKKHWEEGGHDKLCRKIKKAGGAEQYHANKKYAEALAVAVEEYAEDTKGQTCYICTEALHWKTKEGLVRGCACHTTEGFVHVSCLAEQAKILVAEAEENNLDDKAITARWRRWDTCGLCEQAYHGVVLCALGWACWKTYVGRPEGDEARLHAMTLLAGGLYAVGHHEDALSVQEAELAVERRVGASERSILVMKGNLALTYKALGRLEPALQINRDVFLGFQKLYGEENDQTLSSALNYATSLTEVRGSEEAKSLLRKTVPLAQRALGDSNEITLRMRWYYAWVLYENDGATLSEIREAVTTLEEIELTARRVLGGAHPFTVQIEPVLQLARMVLDDHQAPSEELDEVENA